MDLRPDLLATVAHDLRTPLASLQGYLELLLLRQGDLDQAEARNYLHTAVRQSERLSRLVKDLFEWGRLEAGETQPNLEDFALAELLQDVVQRFESEAQQRKVQLRATAPHAPQALVRADIALVERALVALLENALRHTPAGGSVSVEHRGDAGRAHVEVRDTGSGIGAADLAHIFSHYERSERVSGEHGGGEGGLGLAIVRRIVQLHGSELQIASVPGQGTRVTFDLPLVTPGTAAEEEAAPRALTSTAPAGPPDAEARIERLQRELARSEAQREQERATAQAVQRAFEQRYLLALRGAQDGLWEWDIATDAVLLSPRWKSMLGFEDGELNGDKAGWLSRIHADDRAVLEDALQVHLADPQSRVDQPLRLLHKDGRVRQVLSRAVAIRRDDGTPYRVVGLDTDVTQVKHIQTVLEAMVEGTAASFGPDFFSQYGAALCARARRRLRFHHRMRRPPGHPGAHPGVLVAQQGISRQFRIRFERHPVPQRRDRRPFLLLRRWRRPAVPQRQGLRSVRGLAHHRERRPRARPPRVVRHAPARRGAARGLGVPDFSRACGVGNRTPASAGGTGESPAYNAAFAKIRPIWPPGPRCYMTTIRVKENEPFDVALRRFKRTIEKIGLLTDLRAREFYEKPTAERKRKKAAAVKRHFKRVRSMQLPKKLF